MNSKKGTQKEAREQMEKILMGDNGKETTTQLITYLLKQSAEAKKESIKNNPHDQMKESKKQS